jgi:hypothetical protein
LLEYLEVERKLYNGVGKFRPLNLGNSTPLLTLELERRRRKENHEINSLDKAEKNFNDLWNEQNSFDITVQKRLKMIKEHWKRECNEFC